MKLWAFLCQESALILNCNSRRSCLNITLQLKFKLKGQNKNKGLCCHKEREQNYINELECQLKVNVFSN